MRLVLTAAMFLALLLAIIVVQNTHSAKIPPAALVNTVKKVLTKPQKVLVPPSKVIMPPQKVMVPEPKKLLTPKPKLPGIG
jgi:hypothetical protein